MKNLRSLGYCSFLFCLLSLQAQSQIDRVQRRFVLNTDYNRFWQNDTTAYLEISTAVYPGLAILKQDSSGYHGKIELIISIQNKSTGAYVRAERFNIPINFIDSTYLLMTKSLVNKTTYTLGCGSYIVSIHSFDVYDRSRSDSSSFSVDIIKRPDTVVLSDIELCSNISELSDQKDAFYKNTYRVIPNPSCVFGSTSFPMVFTYTEFYNLNIGMVYVIKAQVVDLKGNVVKHRIRQHSFSVPNVVDVSTLNATSIGSGRYNFEIILSDTLGHEIAKSQRPVYINNPNVQSTYATALSAKSAEFAGLSSDELAEEFRTAQYVAHPDEIDAFDKLTTAEIRREFLEKFWTRVENEGLGRSGLTRTIYLQRVLTANQRYGVSLKQGWRTDRGRVYILYGEPDETQRFPSSQDSKPYEIWNYHQIEGGIEFIFIDLRGFNEYTLVHSTKRGEIQDESWEQFLH